MPGEMRFNENEVSNILGMLNNACASLQTAANILNGIDAEARSLGVSNLNTSQVQENISANKGKINNIIQCINNLLYELANAEQRNVGIVGKFGIIKKVLSGLKNTFSTIAFWQSVNSNGEYEVKITDKGLALWKDGVEYAINIEEINAENIGKIKCFILEPENADHNIPTVLCLDGDGPSAVHNLNTDSVIKAIQSVGGGEGLYGKQGNQGGYKRLLLAGINYGGLEKPNARFVYLPNNGKRWFNVSAGDFDGVIEQLKGKYDIDTNNMTLLGHSARRTSSGRTCKRFWIYI